MDVGMKNLFYAFNNLDMLWCIQTYSLSVIPRKSTDWRYFSHSMGAFLPIRFSSYSTLYHIGNTWVSPSISHSIGKCGEIHRIGRAWEIGTHFFPTYRYFSPIRLPSYDTLYHIGNTWLFPSVSNSTGKCSKTYPVSSQVVFSTVHIIVPIQ